MAQSVEQLIRNQQVSGSSPLTSSTTKSPVQNGTGDLVVRRRDEICRGGRFLTISRVPFRGKQYRRHEKVFVAALRYGFVETTDICKIYFI